MQTALSLFLGKEVGSKDGHDKQIKGNSIGIHGTKVLFRHLSWF